MSEFLKKHMQRKPLALPYNSPPKISAIHFDASLHTAAELVATTTPDEQHHPTAA
jgi:hypothetical protein